MFSAKQKAQQLLDKAGITINGPHDFDMQVHNEKLYQRVLVGGSLALGEAYMDGWWDVKNLDVFFHKLLVSGITRKFGFVLPNVVSAAAGSLFNLQSMGRAFQVGQQHYDIGNDIYKAMLGKSLVYSCGYWNPSVGQAKNLDDAQFAKLDLICKKIGLKPNDTILDIGCGWGGLLKYAAEKYGAKGVGITVSKEQKKLAEKECQGLPIKILLQDYRKLTGQFDHIVSVGMFEHVGPKNYKIFFKNVHQLLKEDGLFLLHTIGWNNGGTSVDPWIEKYIFRNGVLPSIAQIGKSTENVFTIEDWHNFGADYDKTLIAWFENFDRNWPGLSQKYSEKFYRMWKYYLLNCAGGFRARRIQLWQIVFSKSGVPRGYTSVR